MIREQIETLLGSIPAKNAFFEAGSMLAPKGRLPAELRARCVNDPAFAWKFVRSFAEARQRLPHCVPPVFLRAYDYLIGTQREASIEAAEALTYPGMESSRAVLEALLLCIAPDVEPVDDDFPTHTPAPPQPYIPLRREPASKAKSRLLPLALDVI